MSDKTRIFHIHLFLQRFACSDLSLIFFQIRMPVAIRTLVNVIVDISGFLKKQCFEIETREDATWGMIMRRR